VGEQLPLIESPVGFRTIQIDPPWAESGGGKIKRGADRHYPLIRSKSEIVRVVKSSGLWLPAESAHLYLWTTNTFLPDALWVMDALGFRYVTNTVWVKLDPRRLPRLLKLPTFALDALGEPARSMMLVEKLLQIGLGQYFRGSHELLLFGVRGAGQDDKTITRARNIPSVIFGTRTRHSAKPKSAYRLIESRSQGPYAEIFARSYRAGWTSWGNEVPDAA
jgi:N6-adenosine-specific RNA methylase IME4